MKRAHTSAKAFTLIEMLTVIAIIGVLAALLFPAIKGALQKAETAQAQNDIKNIEGAVRAFYTEYGKWPNPWPVPGSLNDFSYGAGSSTYVAQPNQGYCENCWLMNVLRAIQDNNGTVCGNGGTLSGGMPTPVNSRNIVFLNIPAKNLKLASTGYSDYVDPWGNPYQITLDTSYDNICSNLAGGAVVNSQAFTPVGTGTVGCVTNTIAVWSYGPLGPLVAHTAKDWITSW